MVEQIRSIDNVNIFYFLSKDGTARDLRPDENFEEFIVIWLDEKLNTSADCITTQRQLRNILNYLKVFTNAETCLEYVNNNNIQNQKIFFIISGLLAAQVIPCLIELPQIVYIYIFCQQASDLIPTEDKARGTFIDKHELFATITQDIRHFIKSSTDTSLFSSPAAREQSISAAENDDFQDFQNFLKVLINNDYNDTIAQKEMIQQCRCYYRGNEYEQQKIDAFERNYTSNDAIKWYTKDSFIYRLLNKALRTRDSEIVYAFRYFIGDLCRQIHQLHWEQVQDPSRKTSTLYRGQILPAAELENLQQHIGEEISMNSFLSTSRSCETAYTYSGRGERPPGFESIIFQIDLGTDEPNALMPFCSIEDISHFQEENEYLFKVGTVFRLIFVEDYGICWLIQLKLTNVSNHLVYKMTEMSKLVLLDFFKTTSTNDVAPNDIDQIIDEIPLKYRDLMGGYIKLGYAYGQDFNHIAQFKCYKKALQIYENISDKTQLLLELGYRAITRRLMGHVHDCTIPLPNVVIGEFRSHSDHNFIVTKSFEYYEKTRAYHANHICSRYHHLISIPESVFCQKFLHSSCKDFETLEKTFDEVDMLLHEWYSNHMSAQESNINCTTGNGSNTHSVTVFVKYRESENKISETIAYKVDTTTTVDTFLKNVCSSVGWLYKWRLQLVYNGHELRKNAMLVEYDVQDNACLVIAQKDLQIPQDILEKIRDTNCSTEKNIITINIRLSNGSIIPISLSADDIVMHLKYRIYDYCSIGVEYQRLIHMGKQIEDACKLSHYNVRYNSMITMTVRYQYRHRKHLWPRLEEQSRNNILEEVCKLRAVIQKVRESDKVTSLEAKLDTLIDLKDNIPKLLNFSYFCGISANYFFQVSLLLRAKIRDYKRQLKFLAETSY